MTRRLYYEDSFIADFNANVVSCRPCDKGFEVVLNKTAFFPEGGGQKADLGTIGDANVLDVQEKDGEVYHYTDARLTVGSDPNCQIDWEIRFRRMQNHTGEHIVSGIVHKLYGYDNVGFHMGADGLTVDFDGYLDKDQIKEIEMLANRAVYDNASITTIFPKPEELDNFEYRSKLKLTENVRLVIIEGYDVCACCAPHLKTTGQTGIIRIFDSIRHKGGIRLSMFCGLDAFDDYLEKCRNVGLISNMLSAKQNETAEAVEHLVKENEKFNDEIFRLKRELEETQIRTLQETDGNICVFTKSFDTNQLRNVVNAGMELCGGICAAFSGSDADGWKYIMGSLHVDMRGAAKDINSALNGRGGGRDTMIQGCMSATEARIKAYFNV